MKRLAEHMRRWGPLGASLFALATILIAAVLYFAGPPAADEAKDLITEPPGPPELLADHADRGPDLERGSTVGAASIFPRPQALFADQRINYEFAETPNKSSRGQNAPEAITIHVTGPGSMDGMKAWFRNTSSQASAHFGVGKDGSIDQYAELADATWHNGILNKPDLSNLLIASWVSGRINPNVKTVGIEVLLAPGEQLNEYPAQKRSLLLLMDWLVDVAKIPADRLHIIGHYQVDSVNRSVDPRCCIDIDAFIQELVAFRGGPGFGAGGGLTVNAGYSRWVAEANPEFWRGFQVNGLQGIWARLDFGLPEDVRLIEVEFFLTSGFLTIWDGDKENGRACFVQGGIVSRCSVFLSDGWQGQFTMEGVAQIDKLVITGAYR